MKRCDNCGWYNPDKLSQCEKCGEPLGDYTLPEPEEQDPQPAGEASFTPAHPLSETEPKPSRNKEYAKTLRYVDPGAPFASEAEEEAAPGTCPKCHYPVIGNPDSCPNCGAVLRRNTRKDASHAVPRQPAESRQPAVPNPMNATIRDGVPAARQAVQSAAAFGKSTIRDIPGRSQSQDRSAPDPARQSAPAAPEITSNAETFRLVPIADTVTPVVYLREGDLVTIGGKTYRFVK
mgnify:CR=1 FL=1